MANIAKLGMQAANPVSAGIVVNKALPSGFVRVKLLFTPQNYSWWSRVLMALYFLTGYHVTPRRDQNG